ncbi:MAG: UDP-N-acetylmuramoyl-L-alanyl-D-glutamate--2,6-diaminopimelate ligase [Phycisphaerales bacterium]|nr:MAG: UDP-N-acetylmuramoyl-L-alanyl-D-glutamate--2,6-diaminopimelate ligase [Phycisphaerales bacterium]
MTLRELCAGLNLCIDAAADVNPLINGLTADSRQVRPGYLFAAIRGMQVDGHKFIPAAIAAGASAILTDRPDPTSPSPSLRASSATITATATAAVRAPDARTALAHLAARFFGLQRALNTGVLRLTGVTGTNGKSTICFLIQAMLNHAGCRCANLGTIQYDVLDRIVPAPLTTPDAVELARLLAEARRNGASHAALEVSSHALDQRRADGLSFANAVFTNLTGDHHDYHGGPEPYLLAKKRLFDTLPPGATAMVNTDDPACPRMVADCDARLVHYGLADSDRRREDAPETHLLAELVEMSSAGTRLRARHAGMVTEVWTPLVGRHNAYNALAAFGVGLAEGLTPQQAAAGIATLKAVPGRLEKIGGDKCPIDVFVDYAHTDDALRNVLRATRQICRGQLTVVFGCGGDRDRTKRPRMAQAAEQLADNIFVTSDNPRTEDPHKIIADIMEGFGRRRRQVHAEPDRGQAIRRAIREAEPGDLVLIAGKGHEDYQIIGGSRRWFDDREVACRQIEERFGGGTRPRTNAYEHP